jgi:subtilisin family serine protease
LVDDACHHNNDPLFLEGVARMTRMLESLEARRLLSAQPLGTRVIDFNGETAEAFRGRWIVQLDGFAGEHRLDQQRRADGMARVRHAAAEVQQQLVADGLFLVRVPTSWETGRTLRYFKSLPGFRSAEPDWKLQTQSTPNDTSFGSLWGLNNGSDTDINAPEAWSITTGSKSVILGVVDSGVLISHPDLAANIWRNPNEIAGNGIDDDANGFVDDINGWDFLSNDNNPTDFNGHGTHVAGTIGAVGNNNQGVAGVNWNVSILPFRTGGVNQNDPSINLSAVLGSMNYMTMMKDRGHNIVGSNHSWGGGGFNSSLNNAIAAHNTRNMMVIAAAGNDGTSNDSIAQYPANYNHANVISVANSTQAGAISSGSNFGSATVDIAAPGSGILSTYLGNSYATLTGTSMASPHVAGVVGLLHASSPGLAVPLVRNALLSTATPVASHAGRTVTGGRLNALNALLSLQGGVPQAPSAPVLASTSDSGVSNSDRITNVASPRLEGTADPASLVEIRSGSTVLANTFTGDGNWAVSTAPLADGVYQIVALASRGSGSSSPSQPLSITIDRTAPAISNIEIDTSVGPHTLNLSVTEASVAALNAGAVTLRNSSTNQVIPSSQYQIVHNPASPGVAQIVYTGTSNGFFQTGTYRLEVAAGALEDVAGNLSASASANFSFLQGDLNRSGRVDFSDLLVLAQSYGQSGRTYAQGNIDFDPQGRVGFDDLLILAQNYNSTLLVAQGTAVPANVFRADTRTILDPSDEGDTPA